MQDKAIFLMERKGVKKEKKKNPKSFLNSLLSKY
jgi:hypothetical protein